MNREYDNTISNENNHSRNNERNLSIEDKQINIPFNRRDKNTLPNPNIEINPVNNKNYKSNTIKNIPIEEKANNNNNTNNNNNIKINKTNKIFNQNLLNTENASNNLIDSITANKKNNYTEKEKLINTHNRINSGVKFLSSEEQNNGNNKYSDKSKQNNMNQKNKNLSYINDLVNGGGFSNQNFKAYDQTQTEECEINNHSDKLIKNENYPDINQNTIFNANNNENKFLNYNNQGNTEFNNCLITRNFSFNVANDHNEVSKSLVVPPIKLNKLTNFNEINSNNHKNNINNHKQNYDSESKIMGDDILEDLDEIKDLDINIGVTKSHKFPRRHNYQSKIIERKYTVSDMDLSSMRESYYNSKILNLNNSSTFNPNLDGVSRNQFFKKFQNKNCQKNILILDSNMTEQDQSIQLSSRSISVISKKNISNFERMDKIRFNKRKNSKHTKTSFLSSFQNLNNISTQRIKKAFFSNIDTLFNDNNKSEMNSFLTIPNKSSLNNTNLIYNPNKKFNYNQNFISNNEKIINYNNRLNKLCGSEVVILIYVNLSIFLKEKKS